METTTKAAGLETAEAWTKEVLTSDEAAKYLGVSLSTLYKLTMGRKIPHYKSPGGRFCYFNRKEIETWMQSIRVSTDAALDERAQRMAMQMGTV